MTGVGRKVRIARRAVQGLVVLAILAVPAVARYANYLAARELDQNLERWSGTVPGRALTAIDAVMRALPGAERERAGRPQRNRAAVMRYAQHLRGGVWSAEIGTLSMTDPLAGAESLAATRGMHRALLVSLAVPLLLTLLLGRVFCSWICPMGFLLEMTDKLRALLRFLELRPRNLRFARGTKYGVLGTGLLLTAALSMPVLGYVYPPAILSRELHDAVFAVFDGAELGRAAAWTAGWSWMVLLLTAIILFEVTLSRRWWCRYACPGGGLYALLGAARPLRVELRVPACTGCASCVEACPMGLNPMKDEMGMECDNCGACIGACADGALDYRLAHPRVAPARRLAFLFLVVASCLVSDARPALAHHILGIPHYAYEDDYPQAPVLTYRVDTGPYEVKMTGYPGRPRPGERCSLHVYIRHLDGGAPFDGEVVLTVSQDRLIGSDPVVYGPVTARLDERLYKFFPRLEEEANYTARIEFADAGASWMIDLPMVAGEPGSPWAVLGGVAVAVVLFLIVIRAARIKMKRRSRAGTVPAPAAGCGAAATRGMGS